VKSLEPLLALQERDLALDRLRHRRETLPERGALATAESDVASLTSALEQARSFRDDVLREERKLEDEAQKLAEQATEADRKLYSGEIVSPRELQALQADVEQLRRHQRSIEDRQLAAMEQREPLDARVQELESELATAKGTAEEARTALAASERVIDDEMSAESDARAGVAADIDPDLVADYERRREKANGVGAARLVGNTCQGCHLSIPATEVERVRKAPPGTVEYCDNCGAILVP
jgi:predicted  nucleic acid-binding Zn-ribbon protein